VPPEEVSRLSVVEFRGRDVLTLLPGLAALGAGVLYAAGAVVKSGQLRDAGLNVRDTLPLVPLQQLLALGIGVVVTSLLWFVVFAFLLWVYLGPMSGFKDQEPLTVGPRTHLFARIFGYLWLPLGAGIVLHEFWIRPFFTAIVTTAGLLLAAFAGQSHRGRRYVMTVLTVYFAIVIFANTASAYVSPEPLPRADIETFSGEKISASLIVTDGGYWYVSTAKHRFRAIPTSEVQRAAMHSAKRTRPRPVLKVVWHEIRSWF
jgi:hypothetical protein